MRWFELAAARYARRERREPPPSRVRVFRTDRGTCVSLRVYGATKPGK